MAVVKVITYERPGEIFTLLESGRDEDGLAGHTLIDRKKQSFRVPLGFIRIVAINGVPVPNGPREGR